MKQRLSKRYLWAMVLGCLLYGMSFLLLFSRCHSLWGKVVSGLLGVLAVTLLPVFYGLCLQRQRPNGQVINRRADCHYVFAAVMLPFGGRRRSHAFYLYAVYGFAVSWRFVVWFLHLVWEMMTDWFFYVRMYMTAYMLLV